VIKPSVQRHASIVLAAISASILAASAACSWLVALGAPAQLRLLFRLVCHGIPTRCLLLFGVPMPICARCTAIYGGLIAGALFFRLLPRIRETTARIVVAVALAPLGIDGLTQLAHLRESTNALRVATGLVAGMAIALWILTAARMGETSHVHASV
jgi:uncharacterized membrane protein